MFLKAVFTSSHALRSVKIFKKLENFNATGTLNVKFFVESPAFVRRDAYPTFKIMIKYDYEKLLHHLSRSSWRNRME